MRRRSPSYSDYGVPEEPAVGFAAERPQYDREQDYEYRHRHGPQHRHYSTYDETRSYNAGRSYRNDNASGYRRRQSPTIDFSRYHELKGNYGRSTYDRRSRSPEPGRYHPTNAPDNDLRQKYRHTSPTQAPSGKAQTPEPSPPPPVPLEPAAEYLQLSERPSSTLDDPSTSRKLLILDLNGTLLYRSPHTRRPAPPIRPAPGTKGNATSQPEYPYDPYRDPSVRRGLRPVHPRPFMPTFRQFLFHPSTRKWLDVMIWSSAQPHSVADMVETAFEEKREALLAVWARDTLGLTNTDYNRKAQTIKDLAKPWAALQIQPAAEGGEDPVAQEAAATNQEPASVHSALTTLLLDDSPLKAQLQPWNHVCISEYVANTRENDLHALRAIAPSEDHPVALSEQQHAKAERKAEKKQKRKDQREAEWANRKAEKAAQRALKAAPSSVADGVKTSTSDEQDGLQAIKEEVDVERSSSKRKGDFEPQENIKRLKSSPADLHFPPFDNTLLAVIGILDTLKSQSNVSSWIRSGGLFGPPNALSEDGLEKKSRFPPPSSPPEVPTASSSPKDEIGDEDPSAALEDGETPAVKMWFDDEEHVEYWAKRGLAALIALDLPLIHGLKDYN